MRETTDVIVSKKKKAEENKMCLTERASADRFKVSLLLQFIFGMYVYNCKCAICFSIDFCLAPSSFGASYSLCTRVAFPG